MPTKTFPPPHYHHRPGVVTQGWFKVGSCCWCQVLTSSSWAPQHNIHQTCVCFFVVFFSIVQFWCICAQCSLRFLFMAFTIATMPWSKSLKSHCSPHWRSTWTLTDIPGLFVHLCHVRMSKECILWIKLGNTVTTTETCFGVIMDPNWMALSVAF